MRNHGLAAAAVVLGVATAGPAWGSALEGFVVGREVEARAVPSFSATIVGELTTGQRIQLHTVRDGWARVTFEPKGGASQKAWIRHQYVRLLESAPEPADEAALDRRLENPHVGGSLSSPAHGDLGSEDALTREEKRTARKETRARRRAARQENARIDRPPGELSDNKVLRKLQLAGRHVKYWLARDEEQTDDASGTQLQTENEASYEAQATASEMDMLVEDPSWDAPVPQTAMPWEQDENPHWPSSEE